MRSSFVWMIVAACFLQADQLAGQDFVPPAPADAMPPAPAEGTPPGLVDAPAVPMTADAFRRVYGLPPLGRTVSGVFLLPGASDPNDIQSQDLFDAPSLGDAFEPIVPFLRSAPAPFADVPTTTAPTISQSALRFGLQLRPGIFYDSGFAGDPLKFKAFSPANIAIDNTPDAHKRGQLTFYQPGLEDGFVSIPVRPQVDLQMPDLKGYGAGQAYADIFYNGQDSVDARTAIVRWLPTESSDLVVGKAETTFGDLGTAPVLIDSGNVIVGAVAVYRRDNANFTGISQLRYTCSLHNVFEAKDIFDASIAIEDQSQLDDIRRIPPANQIQILNRYPAVVGHLRYGGANLFDSYQIAAIVRPMGFDAPDFSEHFTTGWGVSGNARFCSEAQNDAIYLGAVGGQGIGNYIYGGPDAAVISSTSEIHTLSNFGAYASYKHVWLRATDGKVQLSSSASYGYLLTDPAIQAVDQNRKLHQAGCNLIWNATDQTAYGLEYQYGRREVATGDDGDDHRVMLVLSWTAAPSKAAKPAVTAAADMAAARSADMPPAPGMAPPSEARPRSLRRL